MLTLILVGVVAMAFDPISGTRWANSAMALMGYLIWLVHILDIVLRDQYHTISNDKILLRILLQSMLYLVYHVLYLMSLSLVGSESFLFLQDL